MTVRDKIEKMLIDCGMFDSQAKEVVDLLIIHLGELVEGYSISFESPSNHYPDGIYNVLFMQAKPIALKWIDDNKPEAWFREIFV